MGKKHWASSSFEQKLGKKKTKTSCEYMLEYTNQICKEWVRVTVKEDLGLISKIYL